MHVPIPRSEFAGTIRQVNLKSLSPAERQVFDYTFPLFNESPSFNKASRAAVERGESVETPYNYRRFAGGSELRRGCYSTVCVDETGRDNGTLVHELTYYAEPHKSGELYVYDGRDRRLTGEDTRWLGSFPGYRPDPNSIVVAFLSRPHHPHPLLDPNANPIADRDACESFRRSAPQSDQGVALLEVPTTLRHVYVHNVVDLRLHSHQLWLNETARVGIPFTHFIYSEPFEGLVQADPNTFPPSNYPRKHVYKPPHHSADNELSPDAQASRILNLGRFDEGTFPHLLPALVYPGRGGSPITEAIGTMLQAERVQGLIYPSARNDILCNSEGDNIVDHSGWCFVDYGSVGIVPPIYRIIIDPALWCGQGLDIRNITAVNQAGSWELLGCTALTEQRHRKRVEDWYSK